MAGGAGVVAGTVAPDVGERFSRLLRWLQEGIDEAGLSHLQAPLNDTFEIRSGVFGISLFAKRSIRWGSTLALLPLSRLITALDYGTLGPPSAAPQARMAAFAALQRGLGEASPWAAYLGLTPSTHEKLPKYWPRSDFEAHLRHSHFPRYVEDQWNRSRAAYESFVARQEGQFSLGDFEWGLDLTATRSMDLGQSFGLNETLAFFPLFDLAMHGDPPNIQCVLDSGLRALRVTATRSISAGSEVLNGYLRDGSHTTYDVLQNWGFALDRRGATRAVVRLAVPPPSDAVGRKRLSRMLAVELGALEVRYFDVGYNATDEGARTLLAHLRLTESSEGGAAFDGSATTWGEERRALEMLRRLISDHLALRLDTVYQDEQLIASGGLEPRVKFMVVVRRDERLALTWWKRLVERALKEAPASADTMVDDEAYLVAAAPPVPVHAKAFADTIALSAAEIADCPLEFACATAIGVIVWDVGAAVVHRWLRRDLALATPGRLSLWQLAVVVVLMAAARKDILLHLLGAGNVLLAPAVAISCTVLWRSRPTASLSVPDVHPCR